MPTALTIVEKGRSGGIGRDGYRRYTRKWLVEFDTTDVAPNQVAAAVGVPYYASYAVGGTLDAHALCLDQQAAQLDDQPFIWDYTLTYSNEPVGRGLTGTTGGGGGTAVTPGTPTGAPTPAGDQAPADRPWRVQMRNTQGTTHLAATVSTVDTSGVAQPVKLIANSAGEMYSDGIEVPVTVPTLVITAYGSNPNFDFVATYCNKINSDVFLGFGIGTLRCVDWTSQSQYEQGVWSYEKQVVLEIKSEGWQVELQDAGHYALVAGQATPHRDKAGADLGIQPLNGAGARRFPAVTPTPVYNQFHVYRATAFAGIFGT